MNVKAASRANPASRPEPTPVLPAKCCGQSRARLRRVTAAMPITTRNTTANQSRRLTDLDTGMEVSIFTTGDTEDQGEFLCGALRGRCRVARSKAVDGRSERSEERRVGKEWR